jgi:hypothetical protein
MKLETITQHQFTYLGSQRSCIGNNMRVVRERTCPTSSPRTTHRNTVPTVDLHVQQLWRDVHINLSPSLSLSLSMSSSSLSLSLSLNISLSMVLSLILSCDCIQKLNIQLKNQISNFYIFKIGKIFIYIVYISVNEVK